MADIRQIEELSINAWASLQTLVYDGWLIRFSNGYTKRANSVNPLYASTEDIEDKIYYCESLFRARNLKTVFKMTDSVFPDSLDVVLEERGYMTIDHTSVQLLSLSELRKPSIHSVELDERLTDAWLNQFCTLNNQDANKTTMKQMLSLIVPQTCFISLLDHDDVVACGLGVLERGYLGVFDIVTDARYRNQGYGEQLMLNLLKWGIENGAEHAYLQVMLNNAPALRLYAKLGFQEMYRYWYRVKE